MVSVGTIVWLSSELMFFAGLFAMYFTARAQAGGNWPPHPTELNLYQAVPVTLVLIAFILLLIRTKLSKFTPAQATAAIVVSYYWHFVDVVWVGLFAVIYFIR